MDAILENSLVWTFLLVFIAASSYTFLYFKPLFLYTASQSTKTSLHQASHEIVPRLFIKVYVVYCCNPTMSIFVILQCQFL